MQNNTIIELRAMKKLKTIAFIVVVLVVIIWGVAPVMAKAIYEAEPALYSPGMLTALRGLFAIAAMAIFINKGFKKINKSYWICIPAGLILALAYIFQFVGLKYTEPSKNAFLENISCVTIPIFMFIFVREKPTWYSIVAAVICVIGSIFLIGNGFDIMHFFDKKDLLGNGLSALGGLFFGLDIAFTKVFCKDKDPLIYVFLQLCVTTVVSFIYAFAIEGAVFHEMYFTFDWLPILEVVFLGVICMAVCWVARAWAMKYIDAVTVSVLIPLSAVVATVLSIARGMEPFTINLLIGGLIILVSIAISAIFDYRKECRQKQKIDNEISETKEEVILDEPNQS